MHQHFEEMTAGVRYLVCTYSRGPSPDKKGRYRVVVYQMYGSEIEDEEVDAGFGADENHIRLELLAIEAGLECIGKTRHPIVVLTRQDYIPKNIRALRANDFRKRDGKPAANIDIWRRIEALDPESKIEWRFAKEDYDEKVRQWKEQTDIDIQMRRGLGRDPF